MKLQNVLREFGIVVVDNGFVYVGDIEHDGDWCIVSNAQNVRRCGPCIAGLGELALCGPTGNTKLDRVGCVRIPAHAVISVIDSEREKWTFS